MKTKSPFAHEILIVGSTAAQLTFDTYLRATEAVISIENGDIRFWLDGTEPTASEGILVKAGSFLALESPSEIAGFIGIATDANSTLSVMYFV